MARVEDLRYPSRAMRFAVLLACLASACRSSEPPAPDPRPGPPAVTAPAAAARTRIVVAPAGAEPVAAVVQRERLAAERAGERLVVYVGADWCEPCRRFHKAFESGALDVDLPGLRLLEFDLDRDGPRLTAAGYDSDMIPLFAVPDAAGRGTSRRVAGAIKGDGAVGYLTPRIRALLAP